MTFVPASTATVVIDYGEALFAVGYACVSTSTEYDGQNLRLKAEAHSVMLKHSRN